MVNHNEDLYEPDEPNEHDNRETLEFRDFVSVCPNCHQQITEDMDSCPYCGDIIYRYLKNSTFAPRKGPMVKIFAAIIILLVTLAIIGMLLQMIIP